MVVVLEEEPAQEKTPPSVLLSDAGELKGVKKKGSFFFGLPKTFLLLATFFGCQRKSFRYRTKENFDTCPRSEDHIVTELCHFL